MPIASARASGRSLVARLHAGGLSGACARGRLLRRVAVEFQRYRRVRRRRSHDAGFVGDDSPRRRPSATHKNLKFMTSTLTLLINVPARPAATAVTIHDGGVERASRRMVSIPATHHTASMVIAPITPASASRPGMVECGSMARYDSVSRPA